MIRGSISSGGYDEYYERESQGNCELRRRRLVAVHTIQGTKKTCLLQGTTAMVHNVYGVKHAPLHCDSRGGEWTAPRNGATCPS